MVPTPIFGPTGFQDSYWGFRELRADEDGKALGTDALVWAGSPWAGSGGTVFARATDDTLEGEHGKWQVSEQHFNEQNFLTQRTTTQRANMIVYGNPDGDAGGSEPGSVPGEGPRGLRFSQWSYNFAWHSGDVPSLGGVRRHLYPGDVLPIELWSYSADEGVTPLLKFLPLRTMRITFPGGASDGTAVVRFDGLFDLRNEDSKFLWAYLRKREPNILADVHVATVGDGSTSTVVGAFGTFTPTPTPDGANRIFFTKFGFVPGTAQLYCNGLEQRPGVDFTETDPEAGEITLTFDAAVDDNLLITCRTLAG